MGNSVDIRDLKGEIVIRVENDLAQRYSNNAVQNAIVVTDFEVALGDFSSQRRRFSSS